MKKIYEGAEATIYENNSEIVKIRKEKRYRHKKLDIKLRKTRTRLEFRIMQKLYKNKLPVPKPLEYNEEIFEIRMEKIRGKDLKQSLEKKEKELAQIIAKMHNLNIVHGDLTLKNVLSTSKGLVIIDFGLSYQSSRYEDKAMDLFILEETSKLEGFNMENFLEEYVKQAKNAKQIILRLEKIRERRRYL